MRTDKVSVVITNWNLNMFLREALDCLFAQTVQPAKIIIADDCSTDSSMSIIQEYVDANPGYVVLSRRPTREGLCVNANSGARLVETPYFCFLAADDLLDLTYIEKTLKVFEDVNDEKLVVVYTDMLKIGLWSGYWETNEFSEEALRASNFINGNALMRKSMWDEVGGFRTVPPPGQDPWFFEDHYLWVDAMNLYKGYYGKRIPEALMHYRRHQYGHRTDRSDGRRA